MRWYFSISFLEEKVSAMVWHGLLEGEKDNLHLPDVQGQSQDHIKFIKKAQCFPLDGQNRLRYPQATKSTHFLLHRDIWWLVLLFQNKILKGVVHWIRRIRINAFLETKISFSADQRHRKQRLKQRRAAHPLLFNMRRADVQTGTLLSTVTNGWSK